MVKNWYRLFYILFCITGAVLYIALFALKPSGKITFELACFLLAPLAFFVGTIFYNILKSFKSTDHLASYFQLGTGLVATVLFAIGAKALFETAGLADIVAGITDTVRGENAPSESMAKWYSQILVTFSFFGQLIVFGLMPLLKGISKTFAVTPEYKWELSHKKQSAPEPVKEEKPKRVRKPREATPPPAEL